ncbi:MAG: hypothetical protein K0S53_3221 [Bacteroidetes bacterium]|jgi:hypothetical protein|nr:hypothetical protein [Bacteroidota bacterium]
MKAAYKLQVLFLALCFVYQNASSQDLIIKTNGDTIRAKITEVGTNAVSFKKASMPDGPGFVEYKSDIVLIKFSNGEVQRFSKAIPTSTVNMGNNQNANAVSSNTNAATTNSLSQQPSDGKIKIERDGKKYMINGKKVKAKEVDKQLATSKNPAILVPLKMAKITRKSQKIVKLTSIPTTIGGGMATLVSVIDLYNDARRHRDNTSTYVNFGLSLVGTLTLPITSKILKSKSDKMYDKLIDAYNLTN